MESFILQSRNGTLIGKVPEHAKASFESIETAIKEDSTAEALQKQREVEQALQRLEIAQKLAWAIKTTARILGGENPTGS